MNTTVSRVLRLLSVEWIKWRHQSLPWLSIVGCVGIILALAVVQKVGGEANGFACYRNCFSFGICWALFSALVASATQISSEREHRTLNLILPHGFRRSEWIAAKMLAVAAFASILLIVVALTSLAVTMQLFQLVDVKLDDDVVLTRSAALYRIWLVDVSILLPFVSVVISGVLVSTFFSENRTAVMVALVGNAFLSMLCRLIRNLGGGVRWLPHHWLDLLVERLYRVAETRSAADSFDVQVLVMSSLLFAVTSALVAMYTFRLRDVKL